ncbi:hypothetical protein MHL31_09060 [Lutibacter sp. A80]|uniref:hypothetical protein n=1 Tax=Lutibacter sp. A80 TaxID=2918453 RepID=UPI001F05CD46|nr:hypothetical protein [Lutibacter sp. A80]UMB59229.1 hypothetical protein MHL31_09060 [Lutibacter sp. A80]
MKIYLNLTTLQNLLSIFEKAPYNYLSSNRNSILTHNEMLHRKILSPMGIPPISNKELVFRKIYELNNIESKKQLYGLYKSIEFIKFYGLNIYEISLIIDEIVFEIENYYLTPNRTIFNPFS